MVHSLSLRELEQHFTTLVVDNPLSCVMYSIALKVFGFFLSRLKFPFGLYGSILLVSSFALEIKVIENWTQFKGKFLDNLDYQLNKAEQKTVGLIQIARDAGMQQAVSRSVSNPWPVAVNVSRGIYGGASSIVHGSVGRVRGWWNREPPQSRRQPIEEELHEVVDSDEETVSESSEEEDPFDALHEGPCPVM